MGDPCHGGPETRCILQTEEPRQTVMFDGAKLGSDDSHTEHVDAAHVQVQHRGAVLKTYQRRYSGCRNPVCKETDGRTRSIPELDHPRLPPGPGSENAVVRQPGDRESVANNVGSLAAVYQAQKPILITPRDVADVRMQRQEALLKTYQKRHSGSSKHVAADGMSGSSVEHGHQRHRLSGTGSEDSIVMRQPGYGKPNTTNVRNLAPLSIADESFIITSTGAGRESGSNMTPAKRQFTQAVGSLTRPPTGFKQVWQPNERMELRKQSLQLLSMMALKAKEKKQNTTLSPNFSSMMHMNRRSSELNDRFKAVLLNDSDGTNQPVGHACCLCGNDLTYSPTTRLSGLPVKSGNLPDVAILLCGHVFHQLCMQHNMSEEQLKDPQCFLCDTPSI